MPKPKNKQKLDYEELGRRLENIYLMGYINPTEMFKMSLLKGVVTGFGGVIGATIVVALLVWILSFFDTVPLLGPLIQNVNDTVQVQKK